MPANPLNFLLFVLVGVSGLLYSLYLFWKMINIVRKQRASVSWILTTGRVCDRKIAHLRNGDGEESYEPAITYCYTVMGEEFKRTISLKSASFRYSAEITLAEFGDTVEIRYNPEKPKEHISSDEKVRLIDIFATVVFLPTSLVWLWWVLFRSR